MLVVVAPSVNNDDVAVSIEVAYDCDVDDEDKYSLDCAEFSPLALETPFVVVEMNSVVGSSDSTDDVRSL